MSTPAKPMVRGFQFSEPQKGIVTIDIYLPLISYLISAIMVDTMYLRKTSATTKEGRVTYLQLAHNYWDSEAGYSKPKVIYSFGREEEVDREALERLVSSINRYLYPDKPIFSQKEDGGFTFVQAKHYGGTYFLNELWKRFEFNSILKELLTNREFKVDVERLIYTMVANRALNPKSKLAVEGWVEDRVFIPGLDRISVQNLYRSMDFLLEVKSELERKVFDSVAHLLNLEVDLLFFDTTTTYFEVDSEKTGEDKFRKLGYSKDKRPDLLQVVVGLAVTREGIPIKSWVWPGNTQDMSVIKEVKKDLIGWRLGRVISVVDCGFSSEENLRYLQRAGGHYIAGEKIRSDKDEVKEALSRPGRYQKIKDNLRIKEIMVGNGEARTRYVLAYNPQEAQKQRHEREEIVAEIRSRIKSLKQPPDSEHTKAICELRSHPVYSRYIRQLKDGRLKLNKTKIKKDRKYDGKYLIKTSDDTLTAGDVALGYKQLVDIEAAFRTIKQELEIRPVYHRLEERIRAHILLCWLALLLVRVAENATDITWKKIRDELEKVQVGEFICDSGQVFQRTELTNKQLKILDAMGIKKPSRYPQINQNT